MILGKVNDVGFLNYSCRPLRPRFAAVTMFGECQDKREDLALLLLDRGKFVNVSKKSSEEHSRAEYGEWMVIVELTRN